MSHQYGMFGAQAPYAGAPRQWTGVPARPTYGSNPGAKATGTGSLGAVETIEDMQGLTIPGDRLNVAKIYGGLGDGTLTINGTTVPVDVGALVGGVAGFLFYRVGYAALGYYIGSKLGPKGSSSPIAGAVACAVGGRWGLAGLAGVAAYYGGKR